MLKARQTSRLSYAHAPFPSVESLFLAPWLVTPLASRLVCIAKWPDWLAWLAWMARRLAAFICSLIGAKASPALKTNNGAHYSAQMYDQKSCGSHEYGQRRYRAVATVATLDYGYVASCCQLSLAVWHRSLAKMFGLRPMAARTSKARPTHRQC